MLSITGIGGFSEIGKMGIIVETESGRYVWDYGLDVQTMEGPLPIREHLDGAFLSHAHLDHSGLLPLLYKEGFSGNTFLTQMTFELSTLLLRDSIKVRHRRGLEPVFLEPDLENMLHMSRKLAYHKPVSIQGGTAQFSDAGHIPGSSSILLDSGGKRVLFTGDIKFSPTDLLGGAKPPKTDVDVVITEATYWHSDHPSRAEVSEEMREYVRRTVAAGGHVIIPCFAVGRTQEMMMVLDKLDIPVTVDGMGGAATRVILGQPDAVRDPHRLKKAFSRARVVRDPKQRHEALREPGAIITTSGMLQGGPAHFYMKQLHKKENCGVVLNGFQVPGTPGNILLETGRYVHEGLDVKPKMDVQYMDFSAHCDRTELLRCFSELKPKKIIVAHCANAEAFAGELREHGFNAISPKNGERIAV